MTDLKNTLKKIENCLEKNVTDKESGGELTESFKFFNEFTCGIYTLCANIEITEKSEGFNLANKFKAEISGLGKEDRWKLHRECAELFLKMRRKYWTHDMWLMWQANQKNAVGKK